MVADRDSWLPLYGQIELMRQVPGEKRMFVPEAADHNHFVDNVAEGHEWLRMFTASLAEIEAADGAEWSPIARGMLPSSELTDGNTSLGCWRGLCVAHMDAHLGDDAESWDMFTNDVPARLAARGVCLAEIRMVG